jgi:hypothetical protein
MYGLHGNFEATSSFSGKFDAINYISDITNVTNMTNLTSSSPLFGDST